MWLSAGVGFKGNHTLSKLAVGAIQTLGLAYIILFLVPAVILMFQSAMPLVPDLGVFLIQEVVSNLSWWVYSAGTVMLVLNLLLNPNEASARVLLTYVPLTLSSLWFQIKTSVDAIRVLEPDWDEHRGPLYPQMWYSIFSLYDPHEPSESDPPRVTTFHL